MWNQLSLEVTQLKLGGYEGRVKHEDGGYVAHIWGINHTKRAQASHATLEAAQAETLEMLRVAVQNDLIKLNEIAMGIH